MIHADDASHGVAQAVRAKVDATLQAFMDVSTVMLDIPDLPADAGAAYCAIWIAAAPKPSTIDLFFQVYDQVRATVPAADLERALATVYGGDIELSPVLQNLIIVWYNGAIGTATAPARYYGDALVWKVIGGHPLGMPGPYFGGWAYPPERLLRKP